MYTLERVQKRYGDVQVFTDISCRIPTDKFVFVVGPSGSGKSTLLRILSMTETPSAGSVGLELAGERYHSAGPRRPWPTVTCVFQRQFLWPHLTIRENIALPLRLRGSVGIE